MKIEELFSGFFRIPQEKKGFYFLDTPHKEYFKYLMSVIFYLEWCDIAIIFGDKERIGKDSFGNFLFPGNKIIKKGKKYYLKAKVKNEKGDFVINNLLIPQKQAENFFIPLHEYLNQSKNRKRLYQVIYKILENKDEKLTQLFSGYKEVNGKKFGAVKAQNFAEAAGFRDEEKKFMEKISEIAKEKIATNHGFKWATDDHVWDILKEL